MKKAVLSIVLLICTALLIHAHALPEDRVIRPAYAPDKVNIQLTAGAYAQTDIPEIMYAEVPSFRIRELDDLLAQLKVSKTIRSHRKVKDTAWEKATGFDRWFQLTVPGGTDILRTVEMLKASPLIQTANPEYMGYPDTVPLDPLYADNWGHNNTAQLPAWIPLGYSGSHSGDPVGTIGFDSNAQAAWDGAQGFGAASIIIAIIDTGVDLTHPDLRLTAGYDFGDDDADPSPNLGYDDCYHGTCCAGIAGGKANNSIGTTGVAGGCTIMPLKVCTTNGIWLLTYVANALTYAADQGADVISMSFGFSMDVGDSPVTDQAIVYAYVNGTVLFASSGNDNGSSDHHYPSCHPQVISVGAASPCGERKSHTSCDGEYWWGSNYPPEIMAPTILPTTDIMNYGGENSGDYYMWFNGTSCSCPYAAGVAALMLSKVSDLSPLEIRNIITASATDMTVDGGAGYDLYTGYGLVNAEAALLMVGNVWTGAISTNWNNGLNWSRGIPTADSDVLIHPVTNGRYPTLTVSGAVCRSLFINNGASLNLTSGSTLTVDLDMNARGSVINSGGVLTVEGDLVSSGTFNINTAAHVYVYNDLYWKAGAIVSAQSNDCWYQVSGNMTFEQNSNVYMNYGIFYFNANGNSTVYVNEDAHIGVLVSYKASPYILTVDGSADKTLYLNSGLQVSSGYRMNVAFTGSICLYGNLVGGGLLTCSAGNITLLGNANCNITNSSTGGSYFNTLVINLQNSHLANLLTPIKLKGNLLISNGTLVTNNNGIEIYGNWINNVGESGFQSGTGTVTFTGQQPSTITNEHFNTLVNQKYETEQIIIPEGSSVRIASYDWVNQSGTLRVNGGFLMIDDLVDYGIYGLWRVDAGEAEVHQDAAGTLNLSGWITMNGGLLRFVQEGSAGTSTWTGGSLAMSAGVIEFPNSSISIPSGTTGFSCTGGTVRTPYNLSVARSYLHIHYLNFEMYGSTDAFLSMSGYSSLGILTINKAARQQSELISAGKPAASEEGQPQRTNSVNLTSGVNVGYTLNVLSGTLNLNGYGLTAYGGITVSGNIQMASGTLDSYTADFIWENGSTTNITGGNILCEGNWAFMAGSAAHLDALSITLQTDDDDRTITSCSTDSWFGDLTISMYTDYEIIYALSTSSTVPLQVHGCLAISEMTCFDLGSRSAAVQENVTLSGTSRLRLGPDAVLSVGSGTHSLTINSGCQLQALGSIDHLARITHLSGNYSFILEANSTISAQYTVFEYMSNNGVYVKDGAVVNTDYPFSYCIFQNGTAGGTLLTVNNAQTLEVYAADFPANTWGGASNVTKTANQGVVNFVNYTGEFGGESFDNDINNRISWSSSQSELSITSFSAGPAGQYVCYPVVFSCTVLNSSDFPTYGPVRVDVYYDRATEPPDGLAGDQHVYLDPIAGGQTAMADFAPASSETAGTHNAWFRVDALGEISETNNDNNAAGPLALEWLPMPEPQITSIALDPAGGLNLNWTYPLGCDCFKIYSGLDVTQPFTTLIGTVTETSFHDPQLGEKLLYRVTAVKNWP